MKRPNMTRPWTVHALLVLLIFLGLGGLVGGASMLIDPTGRLLGMDGVLPLLPVSTYILPGLFLVTVMGLAPLLLFYCLAFPRKLGDRRSRQHWAVVGSLCLGLTLAVWLFVQGILIGFRWPIQYVTAVNGALIILLALSPKVRRHFERV